MRQFVVEGGGLRVVFERRDDRWGHRVELVADGMQDVPLLISVEGPAVGDIPPSPALQELQAQETADGVREVLGVGAAGACHWSMACGVRYPAVGAATSTALFMEVACRVKRGPAQLASTYNALPAAKIAAATPQSIALDATAADRQIVIMSREASISIDADRFVLTPDRMDSDENPRTVRWTYTIATA